MINGLKKIVVAIGLAVTTSVATFATINAKNKNNKEEYYEYDYEWIKDNDKKKKKKEKNKSKYILDENNINKSKSITESCIRRLSQWRQCNGIPGVVVGVSLRGQTIWTYSEGFADIENDVKCNENTVMRIASISKSMTALLLAKLIQENKINIDLPIDQYLTKDQFPDKYWDGKKVDITLRQLASHLGGIRHYKKDNNNSNNNNETQNQTNSKVTKSSEDKNETKKAVTYELGEFGSKEYYLKENFGSVIDSLKLFKDDPLVAKPGTKYVYTTFGWTLISAVIETQLNGEPFEKYLIKFFREQLGLNNTYLDQNEPIILNRSSYYMKTPNGRLINCPYVDNSYKWAGGGLLSNINDLLRFANIMLYSYKGGTSDGKKGFINKDIVEQMWTPAPNTEPETFPQWRGYGIGWAVVKDVKSQFAYCAEPLFPTIFSHSGAAVGASSMLVIEPNNELVIAIITNLQDASGIQSIALEIAGEFTKQKVSAQQLDELLSQIKPNFSINDNYENNIKT